MNLQVSARNTQPLERIWKRFRAKPIRSDSLKGNSAGGSTPQESTAGADGAGVANRNAGWESLRRDREPLQRVVRVELARRVRVEQRLRSESCVIHARRLARMHLRHFDGREREV